LSPSWKIFLSDQHPTPWQYDAHTQKWIMWT
jgi:hypothetical protein